MGKLRTAFATAAAVALTAWIATPAAATGPGGPEVIEGKFLGVTPPVRELAGDSSSSRGGTHPRVNPLAAGAGGTRAGASAPDPLLSAGRAPGRTPAPNLSFNGVGNPLACGGCTPPDTTGDVGPNHYVQMVNATKVAIFDKLGRQLVPPFNLSNLFGATGGTACETEDGGDPQVLYDELADRWVLAQFQDASPDLLCFAISKGPQPTGAYFTSVFPTAQFPDYFKLGVWPTGYYIGTNESTYSAYAFDRDTMLAGGAGSAVKFTGQTNFLMPADVDGPTPPDDQGGLFYTFKDTAFHGGSNDRIELFQLTPDFGGPGSTFTTVKTINIASFTYTVCGFFVLNCIPQAGTSQTVDAVSEWPMQRLAYRRFAGHESLVGNFTVDVGSDRAGIRWFELRNSTATASGYSLFQQGTQAPADGLHRFMGSIAMDKDGRIALGYSVSGSSAFPSIRYATRDPGDPLGTLQAEQTLQAGGGSQTGSNRWGDYSAMSIDPADDCSFWYTNEYYATSSATNWSTRIGRFIAPGCATAKQLTVSTAGTGSGFVDSSPAGIDCGLATGGSHADCTESYAHGTVVTLTAHPDANTDFVGFSGGGCSGTGACIVDMNDAKSVTATFALKQRQLTVSPTGTGTGFVDSSPAGIDCGLPLVFHADCTESHLHGTVVTLTPHPDANSDFTGFSGGGCSGTAPCAVTMDAAKSVTATFTVQQRELTVTTTGSGSGFVDSSPAGIDCGGAHTDCAESYVHGTAVTLTAHPDAGTDFTGFGGGCSGTDPCTVTMDAAKAVTATFEPTPPPPPNAFSIDGIKRNTRKGTAKMTVTVPGPGDLTLTGKSVNPQRQAHTALRVSPKPVPAAGRVILRIRARGKAKEKLEETGKVKVTVIVTFTPEGGDSLSRRQKVKLKKRLPGSG